MKTTPREAITDALQRLLVRSAVSSIPNPAESPKEAMTSSLLGFTYYPFVVFQDRKKGKFVQFTGDRGRLLLDLPVQSLSLDERSRAAELFPVLGVNSPYVSQLYEYPSGEPADLAASYQVPFQDDVESAARATLDVFSFVFQTPEGALELEIQEE